MTTHCHKTIFYFLLTLFHSISVPVSYTILLILFYFILFYFIFHFLQELEEKNNVLPNFYVL